VVQAGVKRNQIPPLSVGHKAHGARPPPPAVPVAIVAAPASPSVAGNAGVGSPVCALTVTMSDLSVFTGNMILLANDGGRFALASTTGNTNLLVNASLASVAGTSRTVTVQATQNGVAVPLTLPIAVAVADIITALNFGGQTYVTRPDLATGAAGQNLRYTFLRSNAGPITQANRASAQIINPHVRNNSGQLFGGNYDVNLGSAFTTANTIDPTLPMTKLPGTVTPLPLWTALCVYTNLASESAWYAIVENTTGETVQPGVNSMTSPVFEVPVAVVLPYLQVSGSARTADPTKLFDPTGKTGMPLGITCHASISTGGAPPNSTLGDYLSYHPPGLLGGWVDAAQTTISAMFLRASGVQPARLMVSPRDTMYRPEAVGGSFAKEAAWMGWLMKQPANNPADPNGRFYPCGYDRLITLIRDVVPRMYSVDATRVSIQGDCMGPHGVFTPCMRHPELFSCAFALIGTPDFPSGMSPNLWPAVGFTPDLYAAGPAPNPLGTDPNNVSLPDGTTSIESFFDNITTANATATDLPFMFVAAQRHDTAWGVGVNYWAKVLDYINALRAHNHGYAMSWSNYLHENPVDLSGALYTQYGGSFGVQPWFLFATNLSYPAFNNFDADDDYGTATGTGEWDGDLCGTKNNGWKWSGAGIATALIDTTALWQCDIRNDWMGLSSGRITAHTDPITGAIPASGGFTVNVDSTTGWTFSGSVPDGFQVGTEFMRAASITATSVTVNSSGRGYGSTTIAAHAAGSALKVVPSQPRGPNRGPFSSAQVDITPRRRQNFRPGPGSTIGYTASTPGKATQTGTVTVDSSGNFTIPRATIYAGLTTTLALTAVQVIVNGLSVTNSAGTSSPADSPKTFGQQFPRGAVPAGSRVKPLVAGVPLPFQCDDRVFWDDGSLMSASFRALVPALAAGATVSMDFALESGAFDNTSAATLSDVTGGSDFKLLINNRHEARCTYTSFPQGTVIALRQSGGGISAASVIIPSNGNAPTGSFGTLGVVGGGGSGAALQLLQTAVGGTRNSGGSSFVPGDVGAILTSTVGGLRIRIDGVSGGAVNAQTIIDGGSFSAAPGALSFSGASGAGFTFTPTSWLPDGANVTAPGAGFGPRGSGSWQASFNTAAAGTEVELVQYAKGAVCDAWFGTMQLKDVAGGAADPTTLVKFYVERWKKRDGTFLDFKATARLHYGTVDFSATQRPFTCDLEWKNGATTIRGASHGDPGFADYVNFCMASAFALDQHAQLDWVSANGPAWNALVNTRSPAQIAQFKAAGVLPPVLPITPSVATPTTEAPYGSTYSIIPLYQPGFYACCEVPLNTSGTHHDLGWWPGAYAVHHRTQNPAWLRQARVNAAAVALTAINMVEPTTGLIPNAIPAAIQSFPGMTDRSSAAAGFVGLGGPSNGDQHSQESNRNFAAPTPNNSDHFPAYQAYAYLVEGERWMLDQMLNNAGTLIFNLGQTSQRKMTLGTTDYYGIVSAQSDVRQSAWALMAIGIAAKLLPTTRIDGSTEQQQAYLKYVLGSNYRFMTDLPPFIGTIKWGGVTTVSKLYDWSPVGLYEIRMIASNAANGQGAETSVPFMGNYMMQVAAQLSKLWPDIPNIANFRNHYRKYYVPRYAGGCAFLADTFRTNAFQYTGGPPVTGWGGFGDTVNPMNGCYPGLGTSPGGGGSGETTMAFSAGNPTIVLSSSLTVAGSPLADGSRVRLSNSINTQVVSAANQVPAGLDETVWYYYQGLTSTTCQLCTDAALTSPVTPTEAKSGVGFWVIPANACPTAAAGSYNWGNTPDAQSRYMEIASTLRLLKAVGDAGSDLVTAIARAEAINTAIGCVYDADPCFAFDQAF
jgi:hypothetical protein